MKRLLIALPLVASAVFASAPPRAETLDDILGPKGSQCVPMAKVAALSKRVTPLNEAQFDFLRGIFMATPPATLDLIPGDKAAIADDGELMTILFIDSDSDRACVRFMPRAIDAYATLLDVVAQVGAGAKPKAKDKIGSGL